MRQQDNARPLVIVAAAALVRDDGRLLLAQRPEGKSMAGLWELPGGKLEAGESPQTALVRELREELEISVSEADLQPFTFASHAYEKFDLLMPVFLCRKWTGEPNGQEGQKLVWVSPGESRSYAVPDADIPLIEYFAQWSQSQVRQ
jgi:8-oxo-dGTP diphosphatase